MSTLAEIEKQMNSPVSSEIIKVKKDLNNDKIDKAAAKSF